MTADTRMMAKSLDCVMPNIFTSMPFTSPTTVPTRSEVKPILTATNS